MPECALTHTCGWKLLASACMIATSGSLHPTAGLMPTQQRSSQVAGPTVRCPKHEHAHVDKSDHQHLLAGQATTKPFIWKG